jgi:hypothetical protein
LVARTVRATKATIAPARLLDGFLAKTRLDLGNFHN